MVKSQNIFLKALRMYSRWLPALPQQALTRSRCSCPTHQLANNGRLLKMHNIWTLPSVLHDLY